MKAMCIGNAGNRREFLRSGIRYGLLVCVGAVAALLTVRRRNHLPGQQCVSDGICRNCGVLGSCSLPQALSLKRAIELRGL